MAVRFNNINRLEDYENTIIKSVDIRVNCRVGRKFQLQDVQGSQSIKVLLQGLKRVIAEEKRLNGDSKLTPDQIEQGRNILKRITNLDRQGSQVLRKKNWFIKLIVWVIHFFGNCCFNKKKTIRSLERELPRAEPFPPSPPLPNPLPGASPGGLPRPVHRDMKDIKFILYFGEKLINNDPNAREVYRNQYDDFVSQLPFPLYDKAAHFLFALTKFSPEALGVVLTKWSTQEKYGELLSLCNTFAPTLPPHNILELYDLLLPCFPENLAKNLASFKEYETILSPNGRQDCPTHMTVVLKALEPRIVRGCVNAFQTWKNSPDWKDLSLKKMVEVLLDCEDCKLQLAAALWDMNEECLKTCFGQDYFSTSSFSTTSEAWLKQQAKREKSLIQALRNLSDAVREQVINRFNHISEGSGSVIRQRLKLSEDLPQSSNGSTNSSSSSSSTNSSAEPLPGYTDTKDLRILANYGREVLGHCPNARKVYREKFEGFVPSPDLLYKRESHYLFALVHFSAEDLRKLVDALSNDQSKLNKIISLCDANASSIPSKNMSVLAKIKSS